MRSHRSHNRWHPVVLIASLALIQPTAEAQTWQQSGKSSNAGQLQWSVVDHHAENGSQPLSKPSATPQWRAVEASESIDVQAELKKTDTEEITVYPPSGTTFANDKALWRDDQWHPQISSLVPVGFGPQGVMLTGGLYGWDCIPAPYGACQKPEDWEAYLDEIERRGESEWEGSIGFGDTEKYLGLTITGMFEETGIQLGDRNNHADENPRGLFSNYYVGMHLSKSLGPDTSARIGIKNWIDIRDEAEGEAMRGKSAYGVISQRIRLKEDQEGWLPNLYLTAGLGNGEFRSVTEKFQSTVARQRDVGCYTYGFYEGPGCTPRQLARAGARSVSYGELAPIGSIALEAYSGFNLISEWSEGNLKAGFSVRPFRDLGLVITSIWGSLLDNCDWGCTVPIKGVPGGAEIPEDLTTDRIKWSFNINYNIRF